MKSTVLKESPEMQGADTSAVGALRDVSEDVAEVAMSDHKMGRERHWLREAASGVYQAAITYGPPICEVAAAFLSLLCLGALMVFAGYLGFIVGKAAGCDM